MSFPVPRGGRRWIPALALGVACGAHAADDAATWLQRAIQSAHSASYSGIYAHSNGDRTSAVRISHVTVGSEEHERIEPLDGPPLEIVRRNDEMFCYFPDAKTIRLDRRVTAHFFPAILPASSPEAIAASYDLKLGKTESALGFDCQWIRLEPRDGLRYAQSLCAETRSGLVVRAKTFNAQNQVIEQYTFTELKMGSQVARNDVKSIFEARVKRWVTDAQPREEAKSVDTGWTVNDPPAGFRKVTELRRSLPGRTAPVSQLVYTDGVASMSVFIEPNNTPPRTQEASTEDGTTTFFVHPQGDMLVSVLGEVPLATAQQMARSVARRP
ncbi:MAG TPA: MucB/RseB C-terminal domain-containing protein [Usitatibacter sp.]|jgi:sigma-E factor negative regulatory protein RseB|nr:MucB/RseB C-terminal domain-containing protein [Usitatibacter sp.]